MTLRLSLTSLLLCLALALAACGGSGSGVAPPSLQIAVSPTALSVPAGGSEQFIAIVANASNSGVTWTVTGAGAVSDTGLYTAPASVPSPAAVTVTATSQADATKSASATVTVTSPGQGGFSNSSLRGAYVFTFSDIDGNGNYSVGGGLLTADGDGHITAGTEDRNQGGVGFQPNIQFTGTYLIQADGTGTISLGLANGSLQWRVIMLADGSLRFIEYDTNLTGGGAILPQDPNALSSFSLAGPYVFRAAGTNRSGSGSLAEAGELTLDPAGAITGTEDVNDDGAVANAVAVSGAYTLAANGRATAQLTTSSGTANFVFYIVDANHVRILQSDNPTPMTLGRALRQTGSGFSAATLNGGYVFAINAPGSSASTSGAYIDAAGRLDASGSGAFTSGLADVNNVGVTASGAAVGGAYTVANTGRAVLNLTGMPVAGGSPGAVRLAVYFADATEGFAVGLDASLVASGAVWQQSGGPFSLTSLNAGYGLELGGYNANSSGSTLPYSIVMQMTVDRSGNALGREDLDNAGAIYKAQIIAGAFTAAGSGRGTLILTDAAGNSQYAVYLISPARFVLVGMDNFQILLGQANQQ